MIELIAGIVVGIFTIAVARRIKGEGWLYSLGLLTLPGAYMVFAWSVGSYEAGLKELIMGAPFIVGGIALTFYKPSSAWLIIGALWLGHGGYDLVHFALVNNEGTPSWWPVYCAAVDVIVGLYLFYFQNKQSQDVQPA